MLRVEFFSTQAGYAWEAERARLSPMSLCLFFVVALGIVEWMVYRLPRKQEPTDNGIERGLSESCDGFAVSWFRLGPTS
jgi:hypothetical protein